MAITTITSLENESAGGVYIQDYENPDWTGNSAHVSSDQTGYCNMWIPWCTSVADFNDGHYIEIEGEGDNAISQKYWIWQESIWWDDRIRYNTERYYKLSAPAVPGANWTGGNRSVEIDGDGSMVFFNVG